MPKLIFPKDMSDLEGETFEGSDIRDNLQAISDLVNVEGLDWENVEQWSLDSVHPGYMVDEPRTPMKEGFSYYGGGYVGPYGPTGLSAYGVDWTVVDPPGEVHRYVEDDAGIFIISSLIADPGWDGAPAKTQYLRLVTKLAGAWDWTVLWESRIGDDLTGGTPTILGAVKATKAGHFSVRLEYRMTNDPNNWSDHPDLLGFANISVFVVNR